MLSENDIPKLVNTYQNDTLNLASLINFKDILKPIILNPSIKSLCEIDTEGSEKFQLALWLALLSKIKNFYYCNVNIQLNTIPEFQGQSKLFKENSLNYLRKSEADHDIFLINTNHDYYFLKNALKNIFLKDKQQQSICFLYNIFIKHEKSELDKNLNLALEKTSASVLNDTVNTDLQINNSHLNANKYFIVPNTPSNRYGADTAINDFLIQNRESLDLEFVSIPLFYGLCILYSKKIIKAEMRELLSPNKIYSFMANENFFRHIENNRTSLQMELSAIKKNIGSEAKKNTKSIKAKKNEFFFKNNYKKIIEYYFKLTNYKRKISNFKDILNHSADKKIIFFDFFETLVLRLTKYSKDIQFKTAEYACLKLIHMGFAIDIDKFNKIRSSEEKKIHEIDMSNKNYGLFFSIIKNVIFTITKKKIENLVNDIIYYEIRNLINILFIENETIETLLLLKKQGALIAVCVDNFFSEENIRYIASYFNINQHIDLCHMFYTKKSRKLNDKIYQLTLKKIQLNAEQVLYISNKYISNYFSPKKNKIKYLTYAINNLEKYKKLNFRACNAYNRKLKIKKNYIKKTIHKLTWKEKNLIDFMHLNKKILDTSNALYPIIAIFAYQVISTLSILHIKKVFFLSKDCDFIKDVFDILVDNVSRFKKIRKNIQLKVIDINQISSACLAYTNIENIENFLYKIISRKDSLSLKNILEKVGLELSDFSEKSLNIIKRHYNTIDPQFLTTLIKATEFGNELNKLINTKKKSLEHTLSTHGLLTGEKIALIDFLDCNGSIQKNLSYLLQDYKNTEFFGFYFGTNNLNYGKNHFSHARSTLFPGVMFSNNYPHTINKFDKIFSQITKLLGSIQLKKPCGYELPKYSNNIPHAFLTEDSYNALQIKLKKTIIYDTLKILNLFNIANFSSEIAKTYFIKNFLNFISSKNLDGIFMNNN